MKVLLAATLQDGREFSQQMGLDVAVVPKGNRTALRGAMVEHIFRTPAYIADADPELEKIAHTCWLAAMGAKR